MRKHKTTLLIYMSADNNLSNFAKNDLQSIKEASLQSNIDIVVQLDLAKEKGLLCHFNNGIETVLETLDEFNSGSAENLNTFIEKSAQAYPSDRLIVVIWSHGSGVDDRDIYDTKGEKDYSNISRYNFFEKKNKEKELELIGIAYDDNAQDFIDNLELKEALDVSVQIDVLGFDACLMGMFEIAYQHRNQTKVMVGSQFLEPASGWCYPEIIRDIQPIDNAKDIGKMIVTNYQEFYKQGFDNVTQSAYETQKVEEVAKRLNRFALELKEKLENRKALKYIFYDTQTFKRVDYVDLIHFVKVCDTKLQLTTTKELLEALDKMIIANLIIGRRMKNAYGVSIYFPWKNEPVSKTFEEYLKLDFSVEHSAWVELIFWYWGVEKK